VSGPVVLVGSVLPAGRWSPRPADCRCRRWTGPSGAEAPDPRAPAGRRPLEAPASPTACREPAANRSSATKSDGPPAMPSTHRRRCRELGRRRCRELGRRPCREPGRRHGRQPCRRPCRRPGRWAPGPPPTMQQAIAASHVSDATGNGTTTARSWVEAATRTAPGQHGRRVSRRPAPCSAADRECRDDRRGRSAGPTVPIWATARRELDAGWRRPAAGIADGGPGPTAAGATIRICRPWRPGRPAGGAGGR
jgi:hypothetical protein